MIRRRVIVVIALSVMIFTSSTSVIIGLRDAPAAFAAGEGLVVTSSGSPTIFSSRVGMDMVTFLEGLDNITGVSPEVFAFSSWNGRSFVVRGVDFDRLDSVSPVIVRDVALEPVAGPAGYALLGERLAKRLALDPPATITLAGSYASKMELVQVGGTFSSGSTLDDEMLVNLDVARYLSGMGDHEASIIRVATDEPSWLEHLLSPEEARFSLFDLSVSKEQVGPGEEFAITVKVLNWGGTDGSVSIAFADGGVTFALRTVTLAAAASSEVSVRHNGTVLGAHNISASISGDFPVTLHAEVEVVDPYLVASFPRNVMVGSGLQVRLTTHSGEPAQGVSVTLLDPTPSTNITGSDGVCVLPADDIGRFQLAFDASGTPFEGMSIAGSSVLVDVLDPSEFPDEFLPRVVAFSLNPSSIKEGGSASGTVTVENAGSVPGVAQVPVTVDSVLHSTLQVALGAADGSTVSFALSGLSPGAHTVQVGDFSAVLEVSPWYVDNPDLVQLVIRYGGTSTLSSAGAIPIYQAAKLSEGNVSLVLFSLGAVSGLLATMAIVSVFSKEVRENRKRLGILRAIGASRKDIRRLVFPQALAASLVGAVAGVLTGLAVAWALVDSGAFTVFGHVLEFGITLGPVIVIAAGAVAIGLASAIVSAEMAAKETAISSIRDLPDEEPPEKDLSELLGDG